MKFAGIAANGAEMGAALKRIEQIVDENLEQIEAEELKCPFRPCLRTDPDRMVNGHR